MSLSSLSITAVLMGILLVIGCQPTKTLQIKAPSASVLQDEKVKRETCVFR